VDVRATMGRSPAVTVAVSDLRVEHRRDRPLGIGVRRPRLSWAAATTIPGWFQSAYEMEIDGVATGRRESGDSILVDWPGPELTSRRAHRVRVRVWGADGSESVWSEAVVPEAGLLSADDWSAHWITTQEPTADGRPAYFRCAFTVTPAPTATIERARLYATSAGVNQLHLNGEVVGTSILAPGWSAYASRLRYETHDVTDRVVPGVNVIGAVVADGWWRGFLTWHMKRNVYGDRLGLLAQLEVVFSDGTTQTVTSDPGWRTSVGPILDADLYNGEVYDARIRLDGWSAPGYDESGWDHAVRFSPAVGELVAPISPPVRRMEERAVEAVIVTPSGRTILDFGQNLVGRVRFTVRGASGTTVTLRHAEVLEDGELGVRPLRNAKATDRYLLRGEGPESWEPAFTFHGFRYVEVDGWPGAVDPDVFRAVVIHSDIERTGSFTCSDPQLNRLHENAVWGMRGNFVDVPTDCPQRDERLGWTGDLQVFAPTAAFLFDVCGFVADWLEDLRAEQATDGRVPLVVPIGPLGPVVMGGFAAAAWGDAATVVPWTMYERYGDVGLLERQFDSMRAWVDFVRAKAGAALRWPEEFQLGDWLDPDAPADEPWRAKTDSVLVATAYFARSAALVGRAARVLDRPDLAEEYERLAGDVARAFRKEYMAPSGRLSSDSVTAYALAIVFELCAERSQRAKAGARIAALSAARGYRISTGFVGTPLVLPALSAVGDTATAYRLLTETACPSWLYPVSMGATTVWERWDSLRPDGSLNPGEMTSFNHYALGSVADWMQQTIGGISPEDPGYRRLRFNPVPGRGVTSAVCSLRTPYGRAACRWSSEKGRVDLQVEVPPNCSAVVVRPGLQEDDLLVTSGTHEWSYSVAEGVRALWESEPSGR
jgi:alpha-L-rhamnosidase